MDKYIHTAEGELQKALTDRELMRIPGTKVRRVRQVLSYPDVAIGFVTVIGENCGGLSSYGSATVHVIGKSGKCWHLVADTLEVVHD